MDESGLMGAIEGIGSDIVKQLGTTNELIKEAVDGIDFRLLMKGLETMSAQLQEQNNLLREFIDRQ